ncbi:undecaprenyl pyrophosphate phosphatase [Pseudobythopirellula maris]|uniref:Undecaprenyl pyrophosphate phosphatase n=1 Tax=Pseudobythopirellula maris TaxID=2527991 RepID=A0A5C5ZP57_9BACT|nr:phosphatase PAP2 family protein [Pseudobythopirellula maris]TWT88885.1 undecaprenyl pyrophosphate phosphatase [Pseudobythopirellula maris]
MLSPIREFAARFRSHWRLLSVLLVGALALWGFLELADEVAEGEMQALDERLLLALRDADDPAEPVGPRWLEELMRDFTALGGVGVTTLITVFAAGLLWLQDKRRVATLLLVAVVGGTLLGLLLKSGFDRPRPDLVPHGSHVYTRSFPSGHSMTAAVVYLTLGATVAAAQRGRRLRWFVMGSAVLVTVAVGMSRVYLGVHWPTDVLAGWAIGVAWAIVSWLAVTTLARGWGERGDGAP